MSFARCGGAFTGTCTRERTEHPLGSGLGGMALVRSAPWDTSRPRPHATPGLPRPVHQSSYLGNWQHKFHFRILAVDKTVRCGSRCHLSTVLPCSVMSYRSSSRRITFSNRHALHSPWSVTPCLLVEHTLPVGCSQEDIAHWEPRISAVCCLVAFNVVEVFTDAMPTFRLGVQHFPVTPHRVQFGKEIAFEVPCCDCALLCSSSVVMKGNS